MPNNTLDITSLLNHLIRWLSNLRRASAARKAESVAALRDVILAVRKTTLYLRETASTGHQNLAREEALAELWTRLSFRLEDLGLTKLAKRCQVSGQHWADPDHFPAEFIRKADISLESIERLARLTLQEIKG